MRTVSKRPHNFEAEKEDFLTESKRSDKLKPFQSDSLTFLDENPCYRNPEQYEIRCTSCQKWFSLCRFLRRRLINCRHCGRANLIEPLPSGSKVICCEECHHAELISGCSEENEICEACGNKSTFLDLSKISRPRLRLDLEKQKRREIIQEIKRKPYLVVPHLFECRCVWDGCQKFFTPLDCEEGLSRCSHCFKEVPVDFGEPGTNWVFYNRCSHIVSVPRDAAPRDCPTCGQPSVPRPSGIAAPKIKQSIELPV